YRANNRAIIEYARISDLAPSNTLDCFGRNTSIFSYNPITITTRQFSWQHTDIDPLISIPITLIEEDQPMLTEIVCKQVSRCDSMSITGADTICKGQTARYSLFKNSECLKSLEWKIDTAVADIMSIEGDTAITLRFKRSGYIRSNVYNCVVKDSL